MLGRKLEEPISQSESGTAAAPLQQANQATFNARRCNAGNLTASNGIPTVVHLQNKAAQHWSGIPPKV
jgi:hypothetical protein